MVCVILRLGLVSWNNSCSHALLALAYSQVLFPLFLRFSSHSIHDFSSLVCKWVLLIYSSRSICDRKLGVWVGGKPGYVKDCPSKAVSLWERIEITQEYIKLVLNEAKASPWHWSIIWHESVPAKGCSFLLPTKRWALYCAQGRNRAEWGFISRDVSEAFWSFAAGVCWMLGLLDSDCDLFYPFRTGDARLRWHHLIILFIKSVAWRWL